MTEIGWIGATPSPHTTAAHIFSKRKLVTMSINNGQKSESSPTRATTSTSTSTSTRSDREETVLSALLHQNAGHHQSPAPFSFPPPLDRTAQDELRSESSIPTRADLPDIALAQLYLHSSSFFPVDPSMMGVVAHPRPRRRPLPMDAVPQQDESRSASREVLIGCLHEALDIVSSDTLGAVNSTALDKPTSN